MNKELEALERIKYLREVPNFFDDKEKWVWRCVIDSYTEECHTIQKALKALEIIEEKGVNIYFLKETDNVEEYNELIKSHYGMKHLTQEEYDLLKEVLL